MRKKEGEEDDGQILFFSCLQSKHLDLVVPSGTQIRPWYLRFAAQYFLTFQSKAQFNTFVILDFAKKIQNKIHRYNFGHFWRENSNYDFGIFDRESISHGPTSLKIVATFLRVTFNVTVQFLFPQKSQNVLKSLTVPKVSKSLKRLKKSQNVPNFTVKHWKPLQSRYVKMWIFGLKNQQKWPNRVTYFLQIRVSWILHISKIQSKFFSKSTFRTKLDFWVPI